jgi:hypothetical protein
MASDARAMVRGSMWLAVDAEFEVQVRAGGPAGGADGADALALLDRWPFLTSMRLRWA